MLKYEKLVLGDLSTNCYIIWDQKTHEAAVIDPADSGVEIGEEIQRLRLELKLILATHGHFDHLLGALDLRLMFEVPIAMSCEDMFLLNRQKETAEHFLGYKIRTPNIKKVDIDLSNIEKFNLGNEIIEIIKTPGHTPGGICFYSKSEGLLFSGDIIFEDGAKGTASHKYSSPTQLELSIEKLTKLPGDTIVCPGHGEELTILQWRQESGLLWN